MSNNYANLILGADTIGLLKGKKALEDTTRAGATTERAVGKTERGFRDAGRGAASAARNMDGFNKSANQTHKVALAATRVLGSMAAAFFSVNAIGRASETYASIGNSLRAMGIEAGSVAGQIQAIGDIATRTRAPLEGTAQLYQRISIAGKDLGASQKDVLRFTENVGLALAQQGGSAASASGALLQLSQAMAGGTVRAEEFNSILEGAFPIAQAAANAIDGASGSVGKLRNMVVEGKISSKEFFDAILSSSDALEAAFGNTVPTVSQAISVLGTSFTLFVGSLDTAIGASAGLASGVIFLAENMERIATYAATAAIGFGGVYVAGMVAAAASTATLSGALLFLRTALIRTGIGALIVGAGELVYQFTRLVKSAGGFGNAMSLLGDVAAAVWQGFIDSASAIPPALQGVWQNMQGGFLHALANMATKFHDFIWTIANGFRGVTGLEAIGDSLISVADAASEMSGSMARAANDAESAASGSFAKAADTISTAFGPAKDAIAALTASVAETAEATDDAIKPVTGLGDALEILGGGSGGGSAGKAAKALEAAKTETEAFNAAMADAAMTAEDLGTAKANVLIGGIDGVATAFGDWMSNGFKDFKGFANSIVDTFKGMLSQMIALAVRNKIMIGLGLSGGGIAGTAAQAAGGAGGIAGIAGIGSALGTGLTASAGGFLSGGLSGGVGAIGAQLSATAAGGFGMASVAASVGAVAVPLLAVAAAASFFKTKTKELDAGLRITADGMDLAVDSFRKVEKSRFWGLSKKVSTSTDAASAEVSAAIDGMYDQVYSGVTEMAAQLGFGAEAFDDFSKSIKISTKGLSEAEIATAIQDQFLAFENALAGELNGQSRNGWDVRYRERSDGLSDFAQAGEENIDTLRRLSSHLVSANNVMDLLGKSVFDMSLIGADAASSMVDAFGGLEAMVQSAGFYFDKFYSDEEKRDTAQTGFDAALAALNIVNIPQTMDEFRDRVDSLFNQGREEAAAGLIALAPMFVQLDELNQSITDAANIAGEAAQEAADSAAAQLKAIEDASADARKAALDAIRSRAANLDRNRYSNFSQFEADQSRILSGRNPIDPNAFGGRDNGTADLLAELKGMRAELADIKRTNAKTAEFTRKSARANDEIAAQSMTRAG